MGMDDYIPNLLPHPRIKIRDSVLDMIVKIVEGNPGATRVCAELMSKNKGIDPDDAFQEISPLLSLDTEGIYGCRIWMLYKDVCGQDIERVLGVLRASQLGFLTSNLLQHAIDNRGDGLDVDDMLKKVKKRLPNFGKLKHKEETK